MQTATTIRSHTHLDFAPADLARRKEGSGQSVAVCLPARNEQDTVGAIVACIRRELVDALGLVDEIVVIDDHSVDGTAARAADAGARVVAAADVLVEYGEGHGKGEALWKSLYATQADLIVWCDADVVDFGSHYVTGLLGPLLTRPTIQFVKGWYERPPNAQGEGGGRVTELVARPLLSLLFPHLTSIVQPLSGEYAGRREALASLPFVQGYGVDLGLLIDIAARFGTDAIAQVDLGTRTHRNRPLGELAPQAMAVMQIALRRADPTLVARHGVLIRPSTGAVEVDIIERPALVDVPGYRPRD